MSFILDDDPIFRSLTSRKEASRRRRKNTANIHNKRKEYFVAETDNIRHKKSALKTPKACSCNMCGNKRRYEGTTYQEQKNQKNLIDFFEEFC